MYCPFRNAINTGKGKEAGLLLLEIFGLFGGGMA